MKSSAPCLAQGDIFRISGPSSTPLKYSSTDTRFASLQGFLGGAEGKETTSQLDSFPGEMKENLEQRFKSGVNRTDIPRMWGHPSVDRKLGWKSFSLGMDMEAWRRQNGEVLYKDNEDK